MANVIRMLCRKRVFGWKLIKLFKYCLLTLESTRPIFLNPDHIKIILGTRKKNAMAQVSGQNNSYLAGLRQRSPGFLKKLLLLPYDFLYVILMSGQDREPPSWIRALVHKPDCPLDSTRKLKRTDAWVSLPWGLSWSRHHPGDTNVQSSFWTTVLMYSVVGSLNPVPDTD